MGGPTSTRTIPPCSPPRCSRRGARPPRAVATTGALVYRAHFGPCDGSYTCPHPEKEICALGRNVCEPAHSGVADTTVTLDGTDVRHYQVARMFMLRYRDFGEGATFFNVTL